MAPWVAFRLCRQRLERDSLWAGDERRALGLLTEASRRMEVQKFQETAILLSEEKKKWPSRSATQRCGEVERSLCEKRLFAEKMMSLCCGSFSKRAFSATCKKAEMAFEALGEASKDIEVAKNFGSLHAATLDGMDALKNLEDALPPHKMSWRASWQQDDKSKDLALVTAIARRRSDSLTPLRDLLLDLDQLIEDAKTALDNLSDTHDDLKKKLKQRRLDGVRALELLRESPELQEERHKAESLREARRVADAAERTAEEQRKTRIAVDAANADRRRCARSIDRLAVALEDMKQRSDSLRHESKKWRPTSLSECRNDEDPISLDALSTFRPNDLCLLPSGNCIAITHLLAMRRDVDPFTNVALPAAIRTDLEAQENFISKNTKQYDAINDLIANAKAACRAPPNDD